MNTYERIHDYLENLDDDSLIEIHNEYCRNTNDYDDEILRMDDFDEIMSGSTPTDIVNRIFYGGGFNPNDTYFYFNGYANLESGSYACELPIFIGDIARYIERTGDDFGDSDLYDILSEEEEEEEEEEDEDEEEESEAV